MDESMKETERLMKEFKQGMKEWRETGENQTDEELRQRSRQLHRFHDLTPEERFALACALLKRPDIRADGLKALRKLYPEAPKEMLDALIYHWYLDLPGTLVSLLAQIELSLQDPLPWFHTALIMDVINYLYKVLQVKALIPYSKGDVIGDLKAIKDSVSREDKADAIEGIQELIDVFDGSTWPPSIESQ